MKFIGLSLSNCVRDILQGKVAVNDVRFIVAGTYIYDRKTLMHVIDIYREGYWKDHSLTEIVELLEHLFFSGKIIQPRALGFDAGNIASGHWTIYNPDITDKFFGDIFEQPRVKPKANFLCYNGEICENPMRKCFDCKMDTMEQDCETN